MTVRLAFLVLVVAACADEGRPLADWTIRFDDATTATPVELPLRVRASAGTRFELATVVPGSARGATLVVRHFFGPLAATADGRPLDDDGDQGAGEHRYVVPPTDAPVALVLRGPFDFDTAAGFGFAPRLVDGVVRAPSAAAVYNRASATAAIMVAAIFVLLYTVRFLLDRRRVGDLAFAAATLGTVPLLLWRIGVFLGPAVPPVIAVSLAITNGGMLYFLHHAFDRGPVSRRWLYVFAGASAVGVAGAVANPFLTSTPNMLVTAIFGWWLVVQFARLLRTPQRSDALILLVGWSTAQTVNLYDLVASVIVHRAHGVITLPLQIISVGIAIALVLARQDVARQRALERAADELRRQVAARSRELADALARIAPLQAPLAKERTIDGRYRVIRSIGAGGMGSVYEVERNSDGSRLAVKTLRGQVDTSAMARFAREAEIAAELDHPNLLPVLDVGIDDGSLFLVMPLVRDGSLEHQRARFGDVRWARPLLAHIARGLAELHARGIVHRDLKPGNVLLDGAVAKIADFGLARLGIASSLAALTGAPGLTQAGVVFGTPRYMAPELTAGADKATPSSDVFALGLIAVEMLTGHPAFVEAPILAKLAGSTIPPPAVDGVAPSIAACLSIDPALRPTARAVADALA